MTRWIAGEGADRMIFVDNGAVGQGVPAYTRAPTYARTGNVTPRVVGARYSCGQCGNHDIGWDGGAEATPDHPADATYNIFEGGSKAAYAKEVEVHNVAEKHKVKKVGE